jgi:hypothetical protein
MWQLLFDKNPAADKEIAENHQRVYSGNLRGYLNTDALVKYER